MKYTYCYRLTALDLWQLAMYHTYSSLAGMCNLVFTAAMAALAWEKWPAAGAPWQLVLLLGIIWFPVIQPLFVWRRAKHQAKAMTDDISMSFVSAGIQIDIGAESRQVPWTELHRICNRPTALLFMRDERQGYILPDRVVGKQKKELYAFVTSRLENK